MKTFIKNLSGEQLKERWVEGPADYDGNDAIRNIFLRQMAGSASPSTAQHDNSSKDQPCPGLGGSCGA